MLALRPAAHAWPTLSAALSGTYSRYVVDETVAVAATIVGAGRRSNHLRAGAAHANRTRSFQRAAAAATRAWKNRSGDGGHSGPPPSPRPWLTGWRKRAVKQRYEGISSPPRRRPS